MPTLVAGTPLTSPMYACVPLPATVRMTPSLPTRRTRALLSKNKNEPEGSAAMAYA